MIQHSSLGCKRQQPKWARASASPPSFSTRKRIVIGGNLGTNATYFRWLTASIRASIYAEDTRQLLIDRSQLGPDAAALGAAMVAIDHLHELES